MTKILDIGPGRVGSEVVRQAQEFGWEAGLLGRDMFTGNGIKYRWPEAAPISQRIGEIKDLLKFNPDAVFVTTPPFGDKGVTEFGILLALANICVPTIICTKEVWAYRPEDMRRLVRTFPRFGCNASVGGEVGILEILLRHRVREQEVVFELAPNASTNFILSRLKIGSIESACAKAEEEGFLEPGEGSPLSKFDRECLDGVFKACATFNALNLGLGKYLTPDMVDRSPLTQAEFEQLQNSPPRRLVVTFSKVATRASKPPFAGFYAERGGWVVFGGLRPVDTSWIPNGPSAAVRIFHNHEVPFVSSGRGAGKESTAAQLLRDARNLGIR